MGEKSKTPKKGAAKVRHLGRRKAQIARYYERTYAPRKIRHLLKNNGVPAAQSWADKRGARGVLVAVARSMGIEI